MSAMLLIVCYLLYNPSSPLNWLTKRKWLKIFKREPDTHGHDRLVNRSAIGELRLAEDGSPSNISILTAKGEVISFPPIKKLEPSSLSSHQQYD